MPANRKHLFCTSLVLIVLVLFQLFILVAFVPAMNTADLTVLTGSEQSVFSALKIGISAGIAAFSAGLAFLAYKGIKEARTPSVSRSHIVISQIASLLCDVVLLMQAISLYNGTATMEDAILFVVVAVYTMVIFIYNRTASRVRLTPVFGRVA